MSDIHSDEQFTDFFMPTKTLANLEVSYRCYHGCSWGGACSGHEAELKYQDTSDMHTLKFDDKTITLDGNEMAILKQWIEKLDGDCDGN